MALNYTLKLSKRQLETIQRAAELYMRVQMGQFPYIAEIFMGDPQVNIGELKDLLYALGRSPEGRKLQRQTRPHKADMAYDIYQVIRHKLAWERNPKGGMTVDFDTPMCTSGEDLPEIIRNTDVLK